MKDPTSAGPGPTPASAHPPLPDLPVAEFFATQHRAGDDYFHPTLEWVRATVGLPPGRWRRAPLGRNVVFWLGDGAVVKLVPPCWGAADADREAAALECVLGTGTATPRLLGAGPCRHSPGWSYVAMTQLPGRQLGWDFLSLPASDRVELARQQGLLTTRLAQVRCTDRLRSASDSWTELLAQQRHDLVDGLRRGGVPAALVAAAEDYVAAAGNLSEPDGGFVHGDISVQNLVLSPPGRPVEITGLFDFSDSGVGPAEHELISPIKNQLHADPAALSAFWRGAGLDPTDPALQHRVTARSMLWYADELGQHVARHFAGWPASWHQFAMTWCTGRGLRRG